MQSKYVILTNAESKGGEHLEKSIIELTCSQGKETQPAHIKK